MKFIFFSLLFAGISLLTAQNVKICSYNLLKYSGNNDTKRSDLRSILNEINADLYCFNEIVSLTAYQEIVTLLKTEFNTAFTASPYINGSDTESIIFYDSLKWQLIEYEIVSNNPRNIIRHLFRVKSTNDTLNIYPCHLKAGNTSDDQLRRSIETNNILNALNQSNYPSIVAGDFNIYDASEQAFINLTVLPQSPLKDPLNQIGVWHNNSAFYHVHTQSTRASNFPDGGAAGGLDDRFDFILLDPQLINGSFNYVSNSYQTYGNDAYYFNSEIPNDSPFKSALKRFSDHLPISLELSSINSDIQPLQPKLSYQISHHKITFEAEVFHYDCTGRLINFAKEHSLIKGLNFFVSELNETIKILH